MLVFQNIQFFYFDFTKATWDVGDLVGKALNYPVPENSSLTRVKLSYYDYDLIVSGGFSKNAALRNVISLKFGQSDSSSDKWDELYFKKDFIDMSMGRYLHQAVIVEKGDKGYYVVLGGIQSPSVQTS